MADAPVASRHARAAESSAESRSAAAAGDSAAAAPAAVPHSSTRKRAPRVTAVLVAHNGARWLPDVFAALDVSSIRPTRVLAVDTGSRDDTALLLVAALGAESVITLDRDASFGAAVAAAVTASGSPARAIGASPDPDSTDDWLWLLHDDCAPDPFALEALLTATASRRTGRHTGADPSTAGDVGIVGPKVLGWTNRRSLIEVGLTISRSGRRHTGLEPGEQDQGQHDDRQRVLAVGTAGMLIRRDVWDQLGGFDPLLPLFRDDVDLGWRANLAGYQVRVAPGAVVHHVQAASTGRRTIDAGSRRRHLADRRNALYVLLANLPAPLLPLAYLRLILGSLVHTAGFVLGKLPGAAIDEVSALVAVLGRPDRVLQARRARRPLRLAPAKDTLGLLAPGSAQLQRILDSFAGLFDQSTHGAADLSARGHRAAEAGSVDEDAESLESNAVMWLRWLRHPGVVLVAGALLVTLIASRGLLGGGRLMDGALLPAPSGASDLWRGYIAAWHDVGLGSSAVAPPYLAVLAALATILGGKASLAVDVVMLGAVPLAAVFAFVAARRLIADIRVRLWAAATYGLLPATTGAIAGGRIGTVAALVVVPLLALALAAAAGSRSRRGTWTGAWTAALLLAVMTAFVPMSYVAMAAVIVVAVAIAPSAARAIKSAAILVVAPLLLLPWSAQVFHHPGLLLLEAGLPGPDLSNPRLSPVSVVLQASGGPGAIPLWIGVPLVLGGLAALLSSERRRVVLGAWLLVLVGVVLGIGVSLTTVSTATTQTPVASWPGFAVGLVATGLLIACAVTAERARARLSASSFGWRQPVAVGVTLVVAATPLLLGGWWIIRGAGDPLHRRDPVVLPQFVAASGAQPEHPRTLVLRRAADSSLTYALLRDEGPRLGDAETGPPASSYADLDVAVADLVSGRGGDLAIGLARHAVRYVLIAAPVDADLVSSLDSVPTLQRLASSDGAALWQLSLPASRLRLDSADGATLASLPSDAEGADATVPGGPAGRTVVLAERVDSRWSATLDGAPLRSTMIDGWAQGFGVPAAGGHLVLRFDGTTRHRWLLVEGGLVLIVVLLSLPGARGRSAAGEL